VCGAGIRDLNKHFPGLDQVELQAGALFHGFIAGFEILDFGGKLGIALFEFLILNAQRIESGLGIPDILPASFAPPEGVLQSEQQNQEEQGRPACHSYNL